MDRELLLSRLDKVRPSGKDRWIACCPAHDDKTPSLQITQTSGRVLIHCFGGCQAEEILDAVGLTYKVLYPDDDGYAAPKKKPINLEERCFAAIYQADVRKGVKPAQHDTNRYKQILERKYDR